MQTVLESLISDHQTGFMPSRSISTNIRKMLDILEFTQHENIPGLVLNIDYAKCFDSLNHNSIYECLATFRFQ